MKLIVAEMETIQGDLADLRSLCAVIEHGSLTRAGQLLGESKGSVSRRITRLEQQLGVKLLNRSSRAVSPTQEGMAFYRRSVQALALLDEGATELRDARLELSGPLRVTMPVDLGLSVFPPLIAEFSEQYPNISVEILLTETFLDLTTHQIDIAFRATNTLSDSAYILHRLINLSVQLFASPKYLKQQETLDTVTDLVDHRLLLHQRLFGNKPIRFTQGNSSRQVSLNASIIANDFACLKQMALLGAGIAILPTLICESDWKSGQLVKVLPEWSIEKQSSLYLLHEGRRLLPAKVTCFRDFICDRFAAISCEV
ncbi:LysR family transcriptional regulator [Nostoc sp. KVJ3]|uniref:LysR family transcriptional regulator n=1 Tax=Nostoc sp. KVJ3 TaxID=457945 RepID=UPI002237E682|nr:LysR family transcriptional regulator [Nostoc sp. KVJ3]MCW5313293.1 LysR family transcriptional regulator [Nostoc sp. KVJ3]